MSSSLLSAKIDNRCLLLQGRVSDGLPIKHTKYIKLKPKMTSFLVYAYLSILLERAGLHIVGLFLTNKGTNKKHVEKPEAPISGNMSAYIIYLYIRI